jgi:hypothetical protein
MSKGNTAENDVINLIFNATLAAHLGVLSTTGNANLYIALHTGDPGEGGSQTTSECAFGSYARQAVARTGSGWTVSGNQASNAAQISFPECTSGSETVTHVSIGTIVSGAGQIIYSGALTASRAVSSGITLQFAIGALVVTED